MKTPIGNQSAPSEQIKLERTFLRFSLSQRWEHSIVILSISVLLLTGLPQKYQYSSWGQWFISSPQRLDLIQQIHRIFALLLTAEVIFHLLKGIVLMIRRRLSADIFPNRKDIHDAWQTLKVLIFISKKKPEFGKYNFEQKLTYWFLFFTIGLMVVSGFILWFPLELTRILPGGIVPAALLAHSNEAVVTFVFIVIWHFYHVHIARLNLSIFTGRLREDEMQEFHAAEFERMRSQEGSQAEEQGGSR